MRSYQDAFSYHVHVASCVVLMKRPYTWPAATAAEASSNTRNGMYSLRVSMRLLAALAFFMPVSPSSIPYLLARNRAHEAAAQ